MEQSHNDSGTTNHHKNHLDATDSEVIENESTKTVISDDMSPPSSKSISPIESIILHTDIQQQKHHPPSSCPIRAMGQVCICNICEEERLRIIHNTLSKKTKSETNVTNVMPLSTTSSQSTIPSHIEDTGSDMIHTATTTTASTMMVGISSKKRLRDEYKQESIVTTSSGTATSDILVDTEDTIDVSMDEETKVRIMSRACRTILQCIGEDPDREGLQKTPHRWSKALLFLCHGYTIQPNHITNNAIFSENHHEMVVVQNIDIHSLCEHHMVPFTGHVHIGYIPNGKIIGLSKLVRLAELYARRLQVQERLTRQIADSIVSTIEPLGVAVVMECTHYCMVMRGVQKTGTITTTSCVRGCFETNSKTRAEFFSIIHGRKT